MCKFLEDFSDRALTHVSGLRLVVRSQQTTPMSVRQVLSEVNKPHPCQSRQVLSEVNKPHPCQSDKSCQKSTNHTHVSQTSLVRSHQNHTHVSQTSLVRGQQTTPMSVRQVLSEVINLTTQPPRPLNMFEKYHCFGMYKMPYFKFYPLITVKVKATTNLLTNE